MVIKKYYKDLIHWLNTLRIEKKYIYKCNGQNILQIGEEG